MNTELKQKIDKILGGKATLQEKQDLLSQLSDSDFEDILQDETLRERFEQYQEQNPIQHISDINISEKKIDDSWRMIIERTKERTPFHRRFIAIMKETLHNIFFIDQTFWKYGTIVATLLIFIFVPVIYFNNNPQIFQPHNGMRGSEVNQKATMEYSILGSDNKLHRPDRALHESDTLFFRVDAKEDGYCSLYIIHEEQADIIVSDQFLKQGSHDLSSGYTLKGNIGENRIVLVFSNLPVSMDKEYIIASINNKVKSLTVNDTSVSIFQRELRVE